MSYWQHFITCLSFVIRSQSGNQKSFFKANSVKTSTWDQYDKSANTIQMKKIKFYGQIYHQLNDKINVSVQHCVVPLIYTVQLVTMALLAMLGPFTGST